MPFVEGSASSSKGGGKGKFTPKNKNAKKDKKPLVKTNVAKRTRQNDELDELKKQIENYVS